MEGNILKQFSSGFFETAVYVAIALVTLTGIIKCIYPVLRNGTLLNRAVMKLEKTIADAERPIWREARFLGRALRPEWQKFLLNAGQLDLRGMPCRTDEYINEDTAVYKPGHAQLAELIPSLLTSLGILGTFMGLMQGLSNLNFTDAAGTIESIPMLLGGMRYAFATSVAGISCSIVFNMVNRIVVGHAFKALDSFDEAFYELVMPRPLDADVQMLCQKQDGDISMQRNLDAIGNRVSATMEMAISRALHPMSMSVDNLLKGVTREQVDGMQRIVGQFLQQMNASVSGEFTAISETLDIINRGQMAAQENLQRTMSIAASLAADAERIQRSAHDIADGMEKEALIPADNDEFLELMRQQVRLQAQNAAAINSLAQSVSALRERANTEDEALSASIERLDALADDLCGRLEDAENKTPSEPERAGVNAWMSRKITSEGA